MLDAAACERGAASFAAAGPDLRHEICAAFADGELEPARAWSVVMRDALSAFYAHPWAWNEIGFGGPAYPRGYGAFGSPRLGERESWEGEEAVHVDPVRDVSRRGLD